MRAILLGPHRVLGGMSSRRWASVRLIGMLLALAAFLAVVQSDHPHADVAHAQTDNTAPALDGSPVIAGPLLTITYNEDLDEGSTPAEGDYTVTIDTVSVEVELVEIDGRKVLLGFLFNTFDDQTVVLSYTAGTNPVRDTQGNEADDLSNVTVTNDSGPRPSPPEVDGMPYVDGNQLVITYNEDLDTDSNPPTSTFRVSVDSTPVGVTRVGISGMTVSLTLASATYEGQTVTVSYTSSENVDDNPIQDLDGSLADDLTDLAVDNRSGPRPPPPEDPVDPPPVVDDTPPVRGGHVSDELGTDDRIQRGA